VWKRKAFLIKQEQYLPLKAVLSQLKNEMYECNQERSKGLFFSFTKYTLLQKGKLKLCND